MSSLHAIVLAGGSGTRFWPASRKALPKQLLPLGPEARQSLIEQTVERLLPHVPASQIWIATGKHLLDATRQVLPKLPPRQFLGEPTARNTAACIGWATACVARHDPDALVMVLPSDHFIGNPAAFWAAIERALASAEDGVITTLGITPTRPDTGYGYIEQGDRIAEDVYRITRFVEKPNLERALEYLETGRYLWNAGMFFYPARVMLGAIRRHLPELHAGLQEIEAAARLGEAQEMAETARVFESLPAVSIDIGVMEKEPELRVIPASFGWSDLGSWQSAWELAPHDAHGNASESDCVLLDSSNSLVRDLRTKKTQVLVGVGLEGLCIVATDDAILVIPRERAQDVKLVADALTSRGYGDRL